MGWRYVNKKNALWRTVIASKYEASSETQIPILKANSIFKDSKALGFNLQPAVKKLKNGTILKLEEGTKLSFGKTIGL